MPFPLYTTNYSYDNDNRLTQATTGSKSANYTYDVYSRMTGIAAKNGSSTVVSTGITYKDPTSTTTSTQVYKWTVGGTTYTYTYDSRGNITAISDGTNTTSYVYDSLDQLTRENNQAAGKTWVYTYDNGGNILSKSEYAYTTGTLGAALDTISYGYGDSSWKDLLTSYDGQLLTSDEIGNLANDGTWSYTWQHGRQLAQMSRPDASGDTEMIRFRYDSGGHRIGKDSGVYHASYSGGEIVYAGETTRTSYSYLGDTLTQVNIDAPTGNSSLHFTHDELGPMSVTYDGAEYFYLKNAQGDVTGLVNSSGTQVVAYTYDAWGNPLTTTGTMAGTLGKLNPFRYRGYFYDTETGLYYLQSRYYNPETGRFINADNLISGSKSGVSGNNAFSYCGNNPTNKVDASGHWPQFVKNVAKAVKKLMQKVVATVVSAKTSKPTSTSSTTLSKKSVKTPSAYVKRSHITTPKAMLDMGPVIGKVGYSQTVTQQSNSPGLIYSYTDIGNDESRIGTGVNIAGQAGMSVGASSAGNVFVQVQVTKWAHAEISLGIDGIGLLTATDIDNISNNFEFQVGWGAALIMIMPELAAAGV